MYIFVSQVACTAALTLFMMSAIAQTTALEPARLLPEAGLEMGCHANGHPES